MPLWASPMMISNPGKALRIIAIDEVRRGMGPDTWFCSFCSTQHMVIQKQFCFCVVCGACRFDQPVPREPVSLQDPDYRFLLPGVTPYNIQTGHARVDSPLNLSRFTTWITDFYISGRPSEARRIYDALKITFHCGTENERQTGVPELAISEVMGFGPAPWEWCAAPDCARCLGGEGAFYLNNPTVFQTRALGGFHFRHIGPWTGDADHGEPE